MSYRFRYLICFCFFSVLFSILDRAHWHFDREMGQIMINKWVSNTSESGSMTRPMTIEFPTVKREFSSSHSSPFFSVGEHKFTHRVMAIEKIDFPTHSRMCLICCCSHLMTTVWVAKQKRKIYEFWYGKLTEKLQIFSWTSVKSMDNHNNSLLSYVFNNMKITQRTQIYNGFKEKFIFTWKSLHFFKVLGKFAIFTDFHRILQHKFTNSMNSRHLLIT